MADTISDTINVFLSLQTTFETVVQEFEKLLKIQLHIEPSDGGFFCKCYILCTEIALWNQHDLEDDCGIKFSDYTVEIRLLQLLGKRLNPYQNQLTMDMALFLASELCANLQCKTMVVENLQTKIAEFSPE